MVVKTLLINESKNKERESILLIFFFYLNLSLLDFLHIFFLVYFHTIDYHIRLVNKNSFKNTEEYESNYNRCFFVSRPLVIKRIDK